MGRADDGPTLVEAVTDIFNARQKDEGEAHFIHEHQMSGRSITEVVDEVTNSEQYTKSFKQGVVDAAYRASRGEAQ